MTEKIFGIHGLPEKCLCGCDVTIYTSKTQENPGRPFFHCVTRKEDHFFKWVETSVYEELLDVVPKLRAAESDICSAKSEIEEMKVVMEELMEEVVSSRKVIGRCNKMMMICAGFLCIITIVVGVMIWN